MYKSRISRGTGRAHVRHSIQGCATPSDTNNGEHINMYKGVSVASLAPVEPSQTRAIEPREPAEMSSVAGARTRVAIYARRADVSPIWSIMRRRASGFRTAHYAHSHPSPSRACLCR